MDKIYNDTIKETLYKEILDNGLKVYMMPRQNYNRQYAIFATNYGSIDNSFIDPETGNTVTVPDGIAHFLEHKLFEGEEENTFSQFARLGTSTNAFTNFTTTAYLFSGTGNFQQSLVNLLDFVQNPYFTDENVEKEKGIITQEIRMYEDDPNYQAFFNLLQGLYHYHPVRIDIGGTVESIKKITREDLYLCYNTFYHPGNMILFLVGDFDPEETINLVKENQARKDFPEWKGIKRVFPDEPPAIKDNKIEKQMDVNQPLLMLGFKERELDKTERELVKQEIGTDMLLELITGKGTELYQSLYEDGLVDDDFDQHYTRERGYGYAIMGGKTKDPEKLYDRLLAGIKKAKGNLKEEDFSRVCKKYVGDYIESFNSFEIIAHEFVDYFFKGINYFEVIKIIQEIDLAYLAERFDQLFKEKSAVRSVISRG